MLFQQKNKLPQHQNPRRNLAVVSRCNPHWDLSHSVTRSTKHVMHKNLEWSEKSVEIISESTSCYSTQSVITCSKLTIEKKLGQGVKICSKLTINTPERYKWRRSGVFIVNFEHISHLVLVSLLLPLSR